MKKQKQEILFVYILQCADGTLYTGITNNIDKRIKEHNKGTASKYTRSRLPVELKDFMECEDKSDALKKERYIKSKKRFEKLNSFSLLKEFKKHKENLLNIKTGEWFKGILRNSNKHGYRNILFLSGPDKDMEDDDIEAFFKIFCEGKIQEIILNPWFFGIWFRKIC